MKSGPGNSLKAELCLVHSTPILGNQRRFSIHPGQFNYDIGDTDNRDILSQRFSHF